MAQVVHNHLWLGQLFDYTDGRVERLRMPITLCLVLYEAARLNEPPIGHIFTVRMPERKGPRAVGIARHCVVRLTWRKLVCRLGPDGCPSLSGACVVMR
jgi:hypothetical protein